MARIGTEVQSSVFRFRRLFTPWSVLLLSFGMVIFIGAILLVLSAPSAGLRFVDALFMATSAACVTGLAVIDIGTQLTIWGQIVILALIQIGGLGIMTFSTGLLLFLGRSISFRSRFILQDIFTYSPRSDFVSLLRRIVVFTLSFEAIGAIMFFWRFLETAPSWSAALYLAVFHSISGFCNAGLCLFSDSMTRFRSDPVINLTMCILIISGGIGFLVLHEIYVTTKRMRKVTRFWNALSLHSKVVITGTLGLIGGGMILFLLSEWHVTMEQFDFSQRLMASLFQSVTTRTAGFNTLDFSSMNNITLFGTMVLMFIGASPGSTGGGIKTTSFTVILTLGWSRLRGFEHPFVFKRTISQDSVNKALVVFVMGVFVVVTGTVLLLMTELGYKPHPDTDGRFMEYLFEVISAFGTVGLSMGVTPHLSDAGKLVVIVLMFLGRVGPLSLAMAVNTRPARFQYAEEKIMIG